MGKISSDECNFEIPPKVLQMYRAVMELIEEGEDPNLLRVSTITERAGIGKGTAYEYFDSKEEIIIYSIVYQMQTTVSAMEQKLQGKVSFQEKLGCLLDVADVQKGKKSCFLKLVHLFTDNSELSRQVRRKLDSELFRKYGILQFFRGILSEAVMNGELRADLPLDYMLFSLVSRILSYMLFLSADGAQVDRVRMRELVYHGILEELCEEGIHQFPPRNCGMVSKT